MIILYDYWRSSASYRVRIALNLKGLAFESKTIDLLHSAHHSPAYRLLNPQGFVPFLIDGDVALNQSLAILEYLDEAYPDTPALLPKGDPVARARVRAAAEIIACDIHPVGNLRVLRYLKSDLEQEQPAIDAWARRWIAEGFAPLEEVAEARRGPYLFGDAVTQADLCLVPQMYNARRFQVDLTPFPQLVAVDKALNALPAVRKAAPDNHPDKPAAG